MAIYLDNAATTQVDPDVLEAMLPLLQGQFGNPSAIHAMGRKARAAIERARKTIAKSINVSPSEICFTSCGTEANNTALLGSVRDLDVTRIISSPTEHHCILHFLEHLEANYGVEIVYLDVDDKGRVDVDQLAELIADKTKKTLLSLMHANNEIGTMIDFERISKMCHEAEVLFHSDTVQTFAHFPFDLQETPISFMVSSAHKFHGPKGIGFMYVNGDNQISPLIYGGSQERNMRAGTENISGIIGLGKAVELAYGALDEHRKHIEDLRQYCKEKLVEHIPGILFNGDLEGRSLYTVLSTSFPAEACYEMLLFNLDIAGICASGGSACSSGVNQGSHVLKAIDADATRTTIRFSFSKNNTKEDIDHLVGALQQIREEAVV